MTVKLSISITYTIVLTTQYS